MIKLKPEHVGTRVALSNGDIAFVREVYPDDNVAQLTICAKRGGLLWPNYIYDCDGNCTATAKDEDGVALFMDMPNSFDVPVPEWCWWIYVHRSPHSSAPWVIHKDRWPIFLANPPINADGWSPAPDQMPPREDA